MVAASKVAAGLHQRPALEGGEAPEQLPGGSERLTRGSEATLGSSDADFDVPLSFGEQLVLETYWRYKRRPYDRKRQEELAMPRQRAASTDTWRGSQPPGSLGSSQDTGAPTSSQPVKVLPKRQVDELCSRLSVPRRPVGRQPPPGEALVLQRLEVDRAKRAAVNVSAMLERLASPRTPYPHLPTTGERIVLEYKDSASGRPFDLARIAALARPSKRGASCAAWGVQPGWCRSRNGSAAPDGSLDSHSTPRTSPQEAEGVGRPEHGATAALGSCSLEGAAGFEESGLLLRSTRGTGATRGPWEDEDCPGGAGPVDTDFNTTDPGRAEPARGPWQAGSSGGLRLSATPTWAAQAAAHC